jgi:hypothetical protein
MVDLIPINRRKMNTNQPTNQPTNPLHPDVILDRFKKVALPPPVTPPQQSEHQLAVTPPNLRRFRLLFDCAVMYGDPGAESEARQQMHQMHVALELKNQELQGFKSTIESK